MLLGFLRRNPSVACPGHLVNLIFSMAPVSFLPQVHQPRNCWPSLCRVNLRSSARLGKGHRAWSNNSSCFQHTLVYQFWFLCSLLGNPPVSCPHLQNLAPLVSENGSLFLDFPLRSGSRFLRSATSTSRSLPLFKIVSLPSPPSFCVHENL